MALGRSHGGLDHGSSKLGAVIEAHVEQAADAVAA